MAGTTTRRIVIMAEHSATSLARELKAASSPEKIHEVCDKVRTGAIIGTYHEVRTLWLRLRNKLFAYQINSDNARQAVERVTEVRSQAYEHFKKTH
jgi:hypothetical protein